MSNLPNPFPLDEIQEFYAKQEDETYLRRHPKPVGSGMSDAEWIAMHKMWEFKLTPYGLSEKQLNKRRPKHVSVEELKEQELVDSDTEYARLNRS